MYRHTHTKSASSLVPNSNSRKIKVKFDHPDPVKLFCCEVKEQQEASNKCQDQTDQQMLLLLPFKKPAVAVAKVMNTKKIWFTHYHNWTPGHHSHEVSSQQQSYLPGEAQKLDMTWQQYTQIFFSKSKIQPLSSLFWTLKAVKFLCLLYKNSKMTAAEILKILKIETKTQRSLFTNWRQWKWRQWKNSIGRNWTIKSTLMRFFLGKLIGIGG